MKINKVIVSAKSSRHSRLTATIHHDDDIIIEFEDGTKFSVKNPSDLIKLANIMMLG